MNGNMELPDEFVRHIVDALAEWSGLILFRVTGTWAHKGRTGEIDDIVIARDAIEAIRRAWEVEDNQDLRTIHAEWLCPIEAVKKGAWADPPTKEDKKGIHYER